MRKLLIAAALLPLAACNPQTGSSEASTSSAASQSTAAAPQSPTPAVPQQSMPQNAVSLGTYVDPTTMKVGGNASAISTADRLFASVTFAPQPPGTKVLGRVLDAQQKEVTSTEVVVKDISQTNVNLDFGIPTQHPLTTGSYTVEVQVGTSPPSQQTVQVK